MSNFNERKNFMFMKRTTIFIFILLQFTLAQAPNKYRMAGTGVILGEVIHADTGVAIEYASVSLISKKSNEVVTGQLTDVRGVFVFQELKKGNYFLEIRLWVLNLGYLLKLIFQKKIIGMTLELLN